MNKLNYLLLCTVLFTAAGARGQSVLADPEDEPLFVVPTTLKSIDFSMSKLSLELPFGKFRGRQYYVTDSGGKKYNTMTKFWSGFLTFGLVENAENTLIFTRDTKLGFSGELGIMNTVDELQDPARKAGFFYTFELAAFVKQQRFSLYDKVAQEFSDYSRFSPGLRAGLNVFRRDRFAVAFNGSWQHRVDVGEMTSYQKLTPEFFMDAKVASNGEDDGYIGPARAVHQFRLSVATPIYAIPALDMGDSRFWSGVRELQLVISPYYFVKANRMRDPSHHGGVAFSVLTDRIFGKRDTKFSDAVSIGYNFLDSGDKGNGRFVFLSGTFSFGNFAKPEKPEEKGTMAKAYR